MKLVDFVTLFLLFVWFFLALYAVLSPKSGGCRCNPFYRRGCAVKSSENKYNEHHNI